MLMHAEQEKLTHPSQFPSVKRSYGVTVTGNTAVALQRVVILQSQR